MAFSEIAIAAGKPIAQQVGENVAPRVVAAISPSKVPRPYVSPSMGTKIAIGGLVAVVVTSVFGLIAKR